MTTLSVKNGSYRSVKYSSSRTHLQYVLICMRSCFVHCGESQLHNWSYGYNSLSIHISLQLSTLFDAISELTLYCSFYFLEVLTFDRTTVCVIIILHVRYLDFKQHEAERKEMMEEQDNYHFDVCLWRALTRGCFEKKKEIRWIKGRAHSFLLLFTYLFTSFLIFTSSLHSSPSSSSPPLCNPHPPPPHLLSAILILLLTSFSPPLCLNLIITDTQCFNQWRTMTTVHTKEDNPPQPAEASQTAPCLPDDFTVMQSTVLLTRLGGRKGSGRRRVEDRELLSS